MRNKNRIPTKEVRQERTIGVWGPEIVPREKGFRIQRNFWGRECGTVPEREKPLGKTCTKAREMWKVGTSDGSHWRISYQHRGEKAQGN